MNQRKLYERDIKNRECDVRKIENAIFYAILNDCDIFL